jgi:hypothetical protein
MAKGKGIGLGTLNRQILLFGTDFNMKEPIFVYEPIDLDVFETVEKAELKIEPVDVKNSSFIYYDSEGKILTAYVERDAKGIEKTRIRDGNDGEYDTSNLKHIIFQFLDHLGYSNADLKKMELPALVRESLKFTTE